MSEPIRTAATVIAARESAGGPEVLVLERGAGSRFLPGYVAFPGGATDEEDALHAERWFGTRAEAPRACAVRELLEEVGLALTSAGLGPGDHVTLNDVDAAPPRAEQLLEIAHWIAPEDVPVRFDARYFAVAAGEVEPRPDGREAASAWWASPATLLEDWAAERRRLYWPTYVTMRALASCGSLEELLGLSIDTREPDDDEVGRLPRSTFRQD